MNFEELFNKSKKHINIVKNEVEIPIIPSYKWTNPVELTSISEIQTPIKKDQTEETPIQQHIAEPPTMQKEISVDPIQKTETPTEFTQMSDTKKQSEVPYTGLKKTYLKHKNENTQGEIPTSRTIPLKEKVKIEQPDAPITESVEIEQKDPSVYSFNKDRFNIMTQEEIKNEIYSRDVYADTIDIPRASDNIEIIY